MASSSLLTNKDFDKLSVNNLSVNKLFNYDKDTNNNNNNLLGENNNNLLGTDNSKKKLIIYLISPNYTKDTFYTKTEFINYYNKPVWYNKISIEDGGLVVFENKFKFEYKNNIIKIDEKIVSNVFIDYENPIIFFNILTGNLFNYQPHYNLFETENKIYDDGILYLVSKTTHLIQQNDPEKLIPLKKLSNTNVPEEIKKYATIYKYKYYYSFTLKDNNDIEFTNPADNNTFSILVNKNTITMEENGNELSITNKYIPTIFDIDTKQTLDYMAL